MLPRGLEPRTFRLLAERSDQLSYESCWLLESPQGIIVENKASPLIQKAEVTNSKKKVENLGIDPSASRMLSERSTI